MAKKPAPRASKTTRADQTPEAKPTIRAKKQAAEEQFAKADAVGDVRSKADIEAEEIRVGLAARGY